MSLGGSSPQQADLSPDWRPLARKHLARLQKGVEGVSQFVGCERLRQSWRLAKAGGLALRCSPANHRKRNAPPGQHVSHGIAGLATKPDVDDSGIDGFRLGQVHGLFGRHGRADRLRAKPIQNVAQARHNQWLILNDQDSTPCEHMSPLNCAFALGAQPVHHPFISEKSMRSNNKIAAPNLARRQTGNGKVVARVPWSRRAGLRSTARSANPFL